MENIIALTVQDGKGDSYTIQVSPKKEQQINNTNTELIWTDDATKLLLLQYLSRKEAFRDPKVKKRDLWTEIKTVFQKCSYQEATVDMLDKKFRNLKQTYSRIKDSQNTKRRTGNGSIRWKFYDIMDQIFDDNITSPTLPLELSVTPCKTSPLSVHTTNECPVPLVALPSQSNDIFGNSTATSSFFCEPSHSAANRVTRKRARKNLLSYRYELIKTEKDRAAAIRELKKSIADNTTILKEMVELQKKGNKLLERLVNKL